METRKKWDGLFRGSTLILGATILVACASEPFSEQEQFDREYQRIDSMQAAIERFEVKKMQCQNVGGHMVMNMGHGGKIDRRAMATAFCAR